MNNKVQNIDFYLELLRIIDLKHFNELQIIEINLFYVTFLRSKLSKEEKKINSLKNDINYRSLFSYEGQTNNLKVVATGEGGLEEMIEELNSGLIMYAFCRVIDTKTSLPKCLLINWVS